MGRVNESNGYDKSKAKNLQFWDIMSHFQIKWKGATAKQAFNPGLELMMGMHLIYTATIFVKAPQKNRKNGLDSHLLLV